ncbi:MAG: hypothetical protein HC769_08445 [Cyanobacteria bacterium CRU_2_1]|nr:hypothetical protein [Cyanobacteria bacterium RU_5_0]NJR58873.1 hypothetical protein [Cyanobacteria bacterium CRU_2_1]
MLPRVIDQRLVYLFKYWRNSIQIGMRYGNELYAFVRSYPSHDRLQAYSLGCELAATGMQTCVTCASWRYTVWISLRSILTNSTLTDLVLANSVSSSSVQSTDLGAASHVNQSHEYSASPQLEPQP